MKTPPQQFCATSAADAKWTQGLRKFFEYRDLGISEATGGAYNAHVIRVKKPVTEFPHTGPHVHDLEFQMIYILKAGSASLMKVRGNSLFARETVVFSRPVSSTTNWRVLTTWN